MRKIMFYISLFAATGSVCAVTIDEDYMQIMEDRQKSLSSNLALKNANGAKEDAKELEDMFGDVTGYYRQKSNAEDALDWSKDSRDLAAAITKYVASNDFDTAAASATTLAKNCKACHRVYKKK